MTQHTDYTTIPQQVRDIVANKCSLLDHYILVQTGENEFTALILNVVTEEVTQLVFTRSSSYGSYFVMQSEGVWEYTVTNEYYCYSNVGLGAALDLPVMEGVQAHASVVLTIVLVFLIVFKSALFPFRRKR